MCSAPSAFRCSTEIESRKSQELKEILRSHTGMKIGLVTGGIAGGGHISRYLDLVPRTGLYEPIIKWGTMGLTVVAAGALLWYIVCAFNAWNERKRCATGKFTIYRSYYILEEEG